MTESSRGVVYAALVGDVLVAGTKAFAAVVSGSSAMATEALHSTADCANQVLMLVGIRRSRKPPDDTHNFGYGPEVYFWTFVVGVLVLLSGGVLSIAQGVMALAAPHPARSLLTSLAVLAASAMFEGGSLFFGLREAEKVKQRHPGRRTGFWKFIGKSKDPSLYETILEDSASLVGIALAAAGLLANALIGWLWADGLASCLIGLLLICDAVIILAATRRCIAGEAVVPTFARDLRAAVQSQKLVVLAVDTIHLGPDSVLVSLTMEPGLAADRSDVDDLVNRIRAVDDRIAYIMFNAWRSTR